MKMRVYLTAIAMFVSTVFAQSAESRKKARPK